MFFVLSRAVLIGSVLGLVFFQRVQAQEGRKKEAEIYELGEIVVSARKPAIERTSNIVRLTSENIKDFGAKNAAEALYYATGALPTTGRRNQADILIRGIKQNRCITLIDGIPVSAPFTGDFDLSQIPVENIAEIKVIKGASSVLYGPNAMAGVINIVTKKGVGKPKTKFTSELSKNDTYHFSGSGSGKHQSLTYYLSGAHQRSDGWDVSDDYVMTQLQDSGALRINSDYKRHAAHLKLGYEPNEDRSVFLSYTWIDNLSGIPPSDNPDIVRPFFWRWDEWKEDILGLSGQMRFSDLIFSRLTLYHHAHRDTLNFYPDENYDTPVEISKFDDKSWGGYLFLDFFNFGDVGLLKFGTTFNETEHKQQPNSLHNDPWDEFKFIMYSFALEGEITPTKRVTIVPGISYEKIDYRKVTGTYAAVGMFKHPEWPGRPFESKDQEAFNPQISLIFDPVDYLSLSARIAKKTRFPKLQELYSSRGGNFELEPERAISYEIGGDYSFLQQRGRVNLALFFNDIDNYIHRINNRSMFRNISEVEIQGVDFGFYLSPGGGLTTSLGWSYLWKAEDKMHNVDLPETPKHKFNFDLGYDFDFGLRANLFGIYAGKRPVYDNSYSRIGHLESYTVFNFKISQDLEKIDAGNSWFHPFELYGAVYNIGDENYFSEPAFPAPGRSFWVGISLKIQR